MTAYDLSWGRLPPCRPPRLPNRLVMPRQTRFGLARNLRSECKAAQTAPQRMHSGCLGPRLIPISLNPFAPVCPLVAYAWRPDGSAEDGAAAGSPHHPNGGCGRWLFAVRSRVGRGAYHHNPSCASLRPLHARGRHFRAARKFGTVRAARSISPLLGAHRNCPVSGQLN